MAVMPDGHIGKATATDVSWDTTRLSKPLDHCMLILTSADGKLFIADTSSPEGKAECEKIAK